MYDLFGKKKKIPHKPKGLDNPVPAKALDTCQLGH